MSKSVYFRTSLGGYNRQDVNEYLIARSREHTEALNQKNERIHQLEQELELSRQEAAKAAQGVKGGLQSCARDTQNALSQLESAVEQVLGALSQADAEQKKHAAYMEKATKYDRLASTLSDILQVDAKAEDLPETAVPDRTLLLEQVHAALRGAGARVQELLEKLK